MHSNVSQEGVQKVTSIVDALVDAIFQVQKQETINDDQNEADYQNKRLDLNLQIRDQLHQLHNYKLMSFNSNQDKLKHKMKLPPRVGQFRQSLKS